MARRSDDDLKISFFSFQDIITCLTGVMIFVTLIMVLDTLSGGGKQVQAAPPVPDSTVESLERKKPDELRDTKLPQLVIAQKFSFFIILVNGHKGRAAGRKTTVVPTLRAALRMQAAVTEAGMAKITRRVIRTTGQPETERRAGTQITRANRVGWRMATVEARLEPVARTPVPEMEMVRQELIGIPPARTASPVRATTRAAPTVPAVRESRTQAAVVPLTIAMAMEGVKSPPFTRNQRRAGATLTRIPSHTMPIGSARRPSPSGQVR
jgi:hypothetical protein